MPFPLTRAALALLPLLSLPPVVAATQTPADPESRIYARDAVWSPDGRHIAFVSNAGGGVEVFLIRPDGSGCRQLTSSPHRKYYPQFSPDGRRICFMSWDQEGDERRAGVWVMNADGSDVTRVSSPDEFATDGSWTPSGDALLFHARRDDNDDVYIMDVDGANVRRLTDHPAWDATPVMSPDGALVAFATRRDGVSEVYVMDADGSNLRNLTNDELSNLVPSWAPDSRRLTYYSQTPGEGSATDELYALDVQTGEKTRLTENEHRDFGPRFAPDGETIVFSSIRSGNLQVHVMDLQTGEVRQVTGSPCTTLPRGQTPRP